MLAPLPALTREHASLTSALARRRALPPILGRAAATGPAPDQIPQATLFAVAFQAGPARLAAPASLLADILAGIDPAAPNAGPAWIALLLENVLSPALDALAAAFPPLALTLAATTAATTTTETTGTITADEPLPYALGLTLDGTSLRLDLSEPAAHALAAALSLLPSRRERLPSLQVRLAARLAWCTVPLRDLRAACLGDVILPETIRSGHVLLTAGETFCWPARQEASRLTIAGARENPTAEKDRWMQDDALPGAEEAGLDDLPVRLSFELGQLEVTLAELETLGPGHVFELARAEADGVDIVANGKRIGSGRAVTINGTLGVQIVRLAGR